jgi:mycothiol synthase
VTLDLPEGFVRRAATSDDVDSIVELSNAYDAHFQIPPQAIREYLTWIFAMEYVDLSRDTLVLTRDGTVQASALAIYDPSDGRHIHGLGIVHPEMWGRGLGSGLLAWLDGMAATRGAERVQIGVAVQDVPAHDLLAARGYERARSSWDMERSLVGDAPMVPEVPGLSVRTFRVGQDERTFWKVATTAFLDHWDYRPQSFESYRAEMFDANDWDPDLAYLAELDGEVVGEVVALAFADRGYIASVGVLREARGKGVATALLVRAFTDLAARGLERVELSVDASSPTGAVGLYERVGMHVIRESSTFFGPTA